MAEPRKDVKVWFDAEVHAALNVICAHRDVSLTDYIESIIASQVKSYVHDVTLMADEFRRSGISRETQEGPGIGRKGGAS